MSFHDDDGGGTPLPPPRSSEVAATAPGAIDLVAIEPFDGPIDGPDAAPEHHSTTAATPGTRPGPVGSLLRDVLDEDGTGIATIDADGNVLTANRTFLSMVGAHTIADLGRQGPPWGVMRSLLDHLPNELLESAAGGTWHGDFDHHDPHATPDEHGAARVLRATVVVEPLASSGERPRLSLLVHDVTAARDEVEVLRHSASHDPLTGLSDRHHILGHLARSIARQRETGGLVVAIFVDLDHLKYVNDAFGHRAGDRLIASTATRLEQAVRPDDEVARIGGDEFLVVGNDLDGPAAALELAERIRRALSGHLKIGDLDLEFSVSIGIALCDDDVLQLDDDDAASTLVSNADTAMYRAKQSGRGRSVMFTSAMRSDARDRTEMAATLARAVATRELTVHYQPVFSAVSRRAVGAEALVRWEHPRLGRMDPATFIGIAEESGTIGRLGEQVLEQALDDLATWRRDQRVTETFAVHVNVSRVQLASTAFVSSVISMVRARGLRPEQLVLEARETSLLGRAADVDRSIRALRRVGIQVAVDNFGTGPKALAVMTDIGADVLKLDGSLALPTGASETDTRLVRAVVLLAHALRMDVVAERVSDADQLERLRAAGCDMMQGNLLTPPTEASELDFDLRPW